MKSKILSFVIILGEGIFLFIIGIRGLYLDLPTIWDYGKICAGILLIIIGITNLLGAILKFKDRIIFYINLSIGIFLLVIGFLTIVDDSMFWAVVMVPGILLFFENLLILLKKKFPEQKDNFILARKK